MFLGCALEKPSLILGDLGERTISLKVLERGGVLEATNATGALVAGLEADEQGCGLVYVRDASGEETAVLWPDFRSSAQQQSDSAEEQ